LEGGEDRGGLTLASELSSNETTRLPRLAPRAMQQSVGVSEDGAGAGATDLLFTTSKFEDRTGADRLCQDLFGSDPMPPIGGGVGHTLGQRDGLDASMVGPDAGRASVHRPPEVGFGGRIGRLRGGQNPTTAWSVI